jgi:hypothetical protein
LINWLLLGKANMQTFEDLLDSSEGRHFLESEGVFVNQQVFISQLKSPLKPNLANELGVKSAKLVCSGQQVYVDYRQSVLSKIEILRDMSQDKDLLPFFLWVDSDRSGSDNLISKFAWPPASKKGPTTILPPGSRDVEMRFAAVDNSVLMSAIDKLGTYLRQSGDNLAGAKERYQQLRAVFADNKFDTLSGFNLHLTDFLLTNVFGYMPYSVMLSSLLTQEIILNEVDLFVNCIREVVNTFNEAVEGLIQQNINPQLKPLPKSYLPLFFSCEIDNRRLRLFHHIENNDHYAVSRCKCGQEYTFYLGQNNSLSIAEIAQTNRWSPDVCFPIFFNDLVSGFVAGKSSALYLIVMNAVLRKVLGKTAVPILAPVNLEMQDNIQFDSLIFRYLAGLNS